MPMNCFIHVTLFSAAHKLLYDILGLCTKVENSFICSSQAMIRPIYLFLCENTKRRSTLLICDEILLGELSCARKNAMKNNYKFFGVNVTNDLYRIVYFSEWYRNRVMFYLF